MSVCASCQTPLTLVVQDEDIEDDQAVGGSSDHVYEGYTVPDDVELSCHCHFHWQVISNYLGEKDLTGLQAVSPRCL